MIQVNDTVRLITLEAQECESYFGPNGKGYGWLEAEQVMPQIGETFKVKTGGYWIELYELEYAHPASKFEKVTPQL